MKTVTLYLPTFFESATYVLEKNVDQKLRFSAIEYFFSKADRLPHSFLDTVGTLKHFFGGFGDDKIPSGALSALAEGVINQTDRRFWLLASPIECHIDHQSASILGSKHLALTADEVNNLVQEFNTLLAQDGLFFIANHPSNWLSTLSEHLAVHLQDLDEVIDRNMGNVLPQGKEAKYWNRLLTECQMLLSQNRVNQQRINLNKPLISSLWFWGLGQLPTKLTTHFTSVYTNDSVIKGMAMMADILVKDLPHQLSAEQLNDYTLWADTSDFNELSKIEMLENFWFKPLLKALKQNQIHFIKVFVHGCEYRMTKKNLFYFWRKIQTLPNAEHKKNS